MKKIIISAFLVFIFAAISFSEVATKEAIEKKYGSLNVYSKLGILNIYLDNEFAGETPLHIEKIQSGTHYLVATLNQKNIYEKVITIKESELTTIVIGEEEIKKATPEAEAKRKVYRDFSEIIFSGLFAEIGYGSSVHAPTYYYSYEYFEGTALNFGVGYKFGLAPHIDLSLNIERGDYSGNGKNWYIMPISINIFLTYQNPYYVGGKVFYGIGLGYYLTNFRYQGEDPSATGLSLITGMEFPTGDQNSAFFQTGYYTAKNGGLDYNLIGANFTFGYRWWM